MQKILRGSDIKVYLAGTLYNETQGLSINVNYGENEIYGVDVIYPQEIATTRVSVQGQIRGIRVKLSGGLQGYGIRLRMRDILKTPYISLRVKDRHSGKSIFYIPNLKITGEQMNAVAKGVVMFSFSFKGIVPLQELDLF